MSKKQLSNIPEKWKWFSGARFGMFIHFGPYAQYGRGEQVLFREHLDQKEYAKRAALWKSPKFDAEVWAKCAKHAGMKYAVFTARHHDGYCMWNTQTTNYSSSVLGAQCDYVDHYVQAFRKAGLRVGLYYSLADWRIPAYWAGPKQDVVEWDRFRSYVHSQISELLTNYGKIDLLWFDGAWPHTIDDWQSRKLIKMIRSLQPDILINNRLGNDDDKTNTVGESKILGDFGTPEQRIVPDQNRLWESCQTSTWRHWGFASGERWRKTEEILDMLTQSASLGGNLLLNVGPKPDGTLPKQFFHQMHQIGEWMRVHGEAIYSSEPGDVCEFVSKGRQIRKGCSLYLVIRFWPGQSVFRLAGFKTHVCSAVLLTTGQKLDVLQKGEELYLSPLPKKNPTKLFAVIKLVFSQRPEAVEWAKHRLWTADPLIFQSWAKASRNMTTDSITDKSENSFDLVT